MLASILAPLGPADDPMTERILDAAYGQLLDFGIRNLSVEAAAKRVGIARITIYRRFATKDELLRAVLLREGRRIFAEVDSVIAAVPMPDEQLVEGFAATFSAVRRHPLVRRTLTTEPEMVAAVMVSHGGPVIALAREYLAAHIRRGQAAGKLRTFDAEGVAELAVRVSLSFLLTPESCIPMEGDDDARSFARHYLVPAFHSVGRSRPSRSGSQLPRSHEERRRA